MFTTTIKNVLAHKARLAMTALAVILGVGLMSGTLVLTDTVGQTFDDLVSDIYRDTDSVVRSTNTLESQFAGTIRDPMDESVVADVAAVDGVALAEGSVSGAVQVIKPGYEPPTATMGGSPVFGFSWGASDALNPWTIADGQRPVGPDEVAVDRGTAKTQGIAVGDTVTVLSSLAPRPATVTAVVTFGTLDSPGGAAVTLFDLPTAQEIFSLEGKVGEIGAVADDGVSSDELTARIAAALPPETEAITGAAKTAEDQQAFKDSLAFFNTFLLVFALISLFVGMFIIVNTFSIIVAQRTKELALLRAIGASRRQVLASVLGEALLVGLVASAIGAAAGILIAAGLQGLLGALGLDIPSGGAVITPRSMLLSMAVGTSITVIAAVAPSWRAASIPPIAAMRDVALDTSATSKVRIGVGAAISALGIAALVAGLTGGGGNAAAAIGGGAALVFLGVAVLGPVIARPLALGIGWPLPRLRGVTGTLARENAVRNPKRTSLTASALMIGVGLVAFITIFGASTKQSVNEIIDKSVTGDLVIVPTGGFGTGFSPTLTETVSNTEGIADAAAYRIADAELDGAALFVGGVDTDVMLTIVDPDVTSGDMAGMGDGQIAMSSEVAKADGIVLGDTLTFRFPNGDRDLEVVALYENRSLVGDYLIDFTTFEQVIDTQLDQQVFATYADGADPAATQAAVEAALVDTPTAAVQDLSEYKKAQAAPIDQLLTLIYALLGLAVIIALIGIANTLALSIYERTRELGLLRAVGMSRSQLKSVVRWESVIIALLGTVLGLIIGLFFGWSLVQALASQGISAFVVPVNSLVVVVLLAAASGVLAAWRPSRRAANLNILDSIASE